MVGFDEFFFNFSKYILILFYNELIERLRDLIKGIGDFSSIGNRLGVF